MSGGGTSGAASALARVTDAGLAGYTLVNGTGTILAYTAPNDGRSHAVAVIGLLVCSVTEVGGAITATFTTGGNALSHTLIAGAQTGSTQIALSNNNFSQVVIDPNTTWTLAQSSALTVGSAVLYATLLAI